MQHVINVLTVRGSSRSLRSKAARQQQLRCAVTIAIVGAAALAMLGLAMMRASDNSTTTAVSAVAFTGAGPSANSTALQVRTAAFSEPRAAQPAVERTTPPKESASVQSSMLDTAANESATSNAPTDPGASRGGVLSLHSTPQSLHRTGSSAPSALQQALTHHPGAERVSLINAAGERAVAFDSELSITAGGLLSHENLPTRQRAFTGDTESMFSADLINRLPFDGASDDLSLGDSSAMRGLEEPLSFPTAQGDDASIESGQPIEPIEPVTQSLIADDDADEDLISSASGSDSLGESVVYDRPATSGHVKVLSATIPEPFTMPALVCGCLLIGRSRRRRAGIPGLVERLYDERSFKLPPGSSDLTLDQIAALRRGGLVRAAA